MPTYANESAIPDWKGREGKVQRGFRFSQVCTEKREKIRSNEFKMDSGIGKPTPP